MRYPIRKSSGTPRRGIALIAVLLVVAILALAAYRFSDLMSAEAQAADSFSRAQKARMAADSGIQYFAALLAQDPTGQNSFGNPYDNPMFQGVLLNTNSDEQHLRVRFSLVSPLDPDALANAGGNQGFRYGVIDEASKININGLFKIDSSGQ